MDFRGISLCLCAVFALENWVPDNWVFCLPTNLRGRPPICGFLRVPAWETARGGGTHPAILGRENVLQSASNQRELNGTRLMVHAGNFLQFLQFFAVFRFSLGNSRVWGAQFFAVFHCFLLFFAFSCASH